MWTKLTHVLERYHHNKQFRAAYICAISQEILGKEAQVISCREGVLMLGVVSSARAANIQIQSANIMSAINERLGSQVIKKLRFRVI